MLPKSYSKELYHYGVLGMKWGVRRYQNKDGTLTAEGKKRVAENAGRYLDPSDGRDTKQRQFVANSYKRSTILKGESIETAENYLYSYASATLDDIGLKDAAPARNYLMDLFREDPKMKELGSARAEADAKKEAEATAKLSKMSEAEQKNAKEIIDGFENDRWGSYTSTFKNKIGDNDVEFELHAHKGIETDAAVAATEFIKKFDLAKAKEGIAKEYYDGEYSWIDKNPSEPFYYSREDFKNRISIQTIRLDPEWKSYEAWWDDGGTYGYHAFCDEGSMVDMKVRSRSLQG